MKQLGKFMMLTAAAVLVAAIVYVVRVVTEPASSLLAKERERLARSLEQDSVRQDPSAVKKTAGRIDALDYQLAVAYIVEDKPDKALLLLENLISAEQHKRTADGSISSRSYRSVARYYETMIDSCVLKKDEDCAERARHRRLDALSKAEDRKRQEALKEGRHVGREVE